MLLWTRCRTPHNTLGARSETDFRGWLYIRSRLTVLLKSKIWVDIARGSAYNLGGLGVHPPSPNFR